VAHGDVMAGLALTAHDRTSVWPITVQAFFIPHPAKYPLSIFSEFAVIQVESADRGCE